MGHGGAIRFSGRPPDPIRSLASNGVTPLLLSMFESYRRFQGSFASSKKQAELLRILLWNCAVDGVGLHSAFRKPFDLISRRVKTEELVGLRGHF
jgi:hypothetical protein